MEELYKKGLNDPDNHDGVVITHLDPDMQTGTATMENSVEIS